MKPIRIKDETYEVLNRLRLKGETDDAMIRRIVESARCYMIIQGSEEKEDNG